MITYYCLSCGHKSGSDRCRCQVCGASNEFCSEEAYGEEMVKHLDHAFRDYRIDALQNIRKIKYAPAIPAIQKLLSKERDPIIHREAIRTLKEIKAYKEADMGNSSQEYFLMVSSAEDLFAPEIKIIDISQIGPRDHRKLRTI